MALHLGTSGWAYGSWKPGFYPAGTGSKSFLRYYASRFNSVEVNYTFTSPEKLTRELAERWIADVPAGFRFSFKAPWRVTHSRERLRPSPVLTTFLRSLGPFGRSGKLGCVLFQLPPTLRCDPQLLRGFLKRWKGNVPGAFEFRHDSWFTEEVFAMLREAGVALCVAESDVLATPEIATADQIYYRFRLSRYSKAALAARASRIAKQISAGHEVYAYQKHEESPISTRRALAIRRSVESLLPGD